MADNNKLNLGSAESERKQVDSIMALLGTPPNAHSTPPIERLRQEARSLAPELNTDDAIRMTIGDILFNSHQPTHERPKDPRITLCRATSRTRLGAIVSVISDHLKPTCDAIKKAQALGTAPDGSYRA